MLHIGLNPFGIAYTMGFQGQDTPRVNPRPLDIAGYLDLAESVGATATMELPTRLLLALSDPVRLRDRLDAMNARVVLSHVSPLKGDLKPCIPLARNLGAAVVRMPLTPVLCGDRAEAQYQWPDTVAKVRRALGEAARQAADHGLTLAIEDHQDFTSAELMELCEVCGPNVGVCFDIGNALAVGESPLDFARTVAPRVRHVHLKDYRAFWTDEGYRLVRCAAGDGAVPLVEVAQILAQHQPELTASIECGNLSGRHVRLLTKEWWTHYPPRLAPALAAGLAAARVNRLPETDDWRTPWEREESPDAIMAYEQDMLRASVANLKSLGLM